LPRLTLQATATALANDLSTLKEAGYDIQRDVVQNLMLTSVSSYRHLQAARSDVKGYEHLHGYKRRFETMWREN
jgi:hypothetical protein